MVRRMTAQESYIAACREACQEGCGKSMHGGVLSRMHFHYETDSCHIPKLKCTAPTLEKWDAQQYEARIAAEEKAKRVIAQEESFKVARDFYARRADRLQAELDALREVAWELAHLCHRLVEHKKWCAYWQHGGNCNCEMVAVHGALAKFEALDQPPSVTIEPKEQPST